MISKKNRLALAVAAAVAFGVPASAFATNGYFMAGTSVKDQGMAGADVALPLDSMVAATNPAGMVWVGTRLDVGASLFSPDRGYTVNGPVATPSGCGAQCPFSIGPGEVTSGSDLFLIPQFGYNRMLDDNSSVGIDVYAQGGMNTSYGAQNSATFSPNGGTNYFTFPGTFGGGTTGIDLNQLFINGSYSRKITSNTSVGASLILADQWFKASGLGNFAPYSSAPNNLSGNGYDNSFGAGFKLGVLSHVTPRLSLGASYQSKIYMSAFGKYSGLFAGGGNFDIPATATVGLAFKTVPDQVLTFDVQDIFYSQVASIANPLIPNLQTSQLGNNNGAGFGWRDMVISKLGYQWTMNPQWTLRAGYSYGRQPIPSSEVLFNILAPGVMQQHVTVGFTRHLANNDEINFAAMYAPTETVSGPNPLNPGQTISLKMTQYQLALGWAKKF